MSEVPTVHTLRARWAAFLAKVEATFDETLEESRPMLLDLVGPASQGGLGPYTNAWVGVRGQLMGLANKIDHTWQKTVRPQLLEAARRETQGTGGDVWDVLDEVEESQRGSEVSERLLHRLERAGMELDGQAALRVLDIAAQSAQCRLRCAECDADLAVGEEPYVAHYVACEYCGRRNVYEPSTDLREVAWFAVDHVARYRALTEWEALQVEHERHRRARHPVPEPILAARAQAHRAYHERVLRERIRIRPSFQATFDQDLQARLQSLS